MEGRSRRYLQKKKTEESQKRGVTQIWCKWTAFRKHMKRGGREKKHMKKDCEEEKQKQLRITYARCLENFDETVEKLLLSAMNDGQTDEENRRRRR